MTYLSDLDKCPECGSIHIHVGDLEHQPGLRQVTQRVECDDCGAVWVDEYDYMRTDVVNTGYGPKEEVPPIIQQMFDWMAEGNEGVFVPDLEALR